MTITANVGVPGSGKTLHAVGDTIVAALRERRLVVTNIPLTLPTLGRFVGADIAHLVKVLEDEDCDGAVPFSDVQHFIKYQDWRSEEGLSCLFVVDECHEPFGEILGNIKGDHPITHWFAKHRHQGCDVLLITQSAIEIPVSIRRRVEFIYEFRKLTALGFGNRFVKRTFYGKGTDPIDRQVGKYNPKWFGLYNSRGKGVAERLPQQRNVLISWKMYLLVALLLIALMLVSIFSGSGTFFGSSSPEPPAKPAAQTSSLSPVSPHTSALANSVGLTESQDPDVLEMRKKIDLLRLEQTWEALNGAARQTGGRLVPSSGENPNVTYVEALPPKRHYLDGSAVKITGYVSAGAAPTYWLDVVDRDGKQSLWDSEDLRQFGFDVMAVTPCTAWLKREGEAHRLSCDSPSHIGQQDRADLIKFPAVVVE